MLGVSTVTRPTAGRRPPRHPPLDGRPECIVDDLQVGTVDCNRLVPGDLLPFSIAEDVSADTVRLPADVQLSPENGADTDATLLIGLLF